MVLCTQNVLNIKFMNCLFDRMRLMIFEELGIVGSEEHPTYKKKKAIISYPIISNIGIQNCLKHEHYKGNLEFQRPQLQYVNHNTTIKHLKSINSISTMHQSQHAIQVVSKNIVSLDLLISITLSLFANQRYQKGRGVFSSKKARTS